MELQELNHWWTEKQVRAQLIPKTCRQLFFEVEKELGRRQIQIIVGLRRVGKSTIFYQLISRLIRKNGSSTDLGQVCSTLLEV